MERRRNLRLSNMQGRGYNVVILQGNQYQVMANTIAPQYPKTLFVCVDCFQANYSNVFRIWYDLGGGGFIEGFMAGMLTHTNTLGLIGGGRIASIWAGHEGFKLGALYANPNVKFTEKFEAISWADSAGAQSDASLMYTNGADIVFSSGDGIDVGVVGAALATTNPSGYSTSNPALRSGRRLCMQMRHRPNQPQTQCCWARSSWTGDHCSTMPSLPM